MERLKISPSQVNTFRMCPRRYCWEYVWGMRPPSTAKQQFGTDVHSHIENWLRTATMPPATPSGRTALQGLHLLPAPDDRLVVEDKFKYFWTEGIDVGGLADVLVPPELSPVLGYPMVIDHKTTSDLRWAKTAEKLLVDPQFLIYSVYAMLRWDVSDVVARWVYYVASAPRNGARQPKGVRAITARASANDPIFRSHLARLTDDMKVIHGIRIAKPDANKLPASPESCGAYGGCPHAERCKLTSSDRLEAYMKKPTFAK